MSLSDLLETLQALPSEAPVVFLTDEGEIGAGYHVTELKLSHVTSIDCGARIASWSEAALQLLDGADGGHMTAGKLSAILRQSIARVSGLAAVPLKAEFAHGNEGMHLYGIDTPELEGAKVVVRLTQLRAHCKPALEMPANQNMSACCGTSPQSQCCG
ncbi:DUF6428 family protein [uncultured Roseibium sp.]|uniref:DUF6428 family protein n=1 Tax=uncultured Roseibium sp. TaxID=1936171 RepID=UPI00261E8131|nr:DUF6428 family protein [uncultured Roseibium sp.]